MLQLADFVRKFGELLSPLVEFARKFRGFLALVAFLVLAGIFLFAFLFSQGSFDGLIANLEKLSPEQFYNIVVFCLLAFFGLTAMLVLLSYRDETGGDDRYTLSVMVHEADDATVPVGSAIVTLVLDEAIPERTNERGGATFKFGRNWQNQECQINARHENYESRSPLTVKLRPRERVLIPLTRIEEQMTGPVNPAPKIFISHSPGDAEEAQKLASLLQVNGFYVWPLRPARPAGVDPSQQGEEAVRRSDCVVVLLSKTTARSTTVRREVAVAQSSGKPIVLVRLEPAVPLPVGVLGVEPIEIYKDWRAEGARLCQRLRRLQSTARSAAIGKNRPVAEPPSADLNPFVVGSAVRPELFVGRQEALNLIRGRIGGELQSISVVANRRMGKTSLLSYLSARHTQLLSPQHQWVVVYMDMMDVRTHTVAGVMRMLRKAIARQLKRDLWDEKYDGALGVMAEAFEELAEFEDVRLVLCLDEWENVMTHSQLDSLIEQLRASGSMSRLGMVVSTAQELSELTESGGLTSPFYNIFETLYLGLMPEAEWTELVRRAYQRSGREVPFRDLGLVGELAGGHPHLTQLAGSLVWEAPKKQWSKAQVCEIYEHKARPLFAKLWQNQSEVQKNVIREVLDAPPTAPAAKDVWDGLKRRGMLTPAGEIFCKPFADYVRVHDRRAADHAQ